MVSVDPSASRKRSSRATDPRPGRTRLAILDAIATLGNRGEALTVAAVAETAGISRTTFYSQFRDFSDVAVQLIGEMNACFAEEDHASMSEAEVNPLTVFTSTLLDEFATKKDLYTAVFRANITVDAYRNLLEVLAQHLESAMTHIAPEPITAKVAARYTAGGVLTTVIDWLLDEHPASSDEVQQQLLAMLPPWCTQDDR